MGIIAVLALGAIASGAGVYAMSRQRRSAKRGMHTAAPGHHAPHAQRGYGPDQSTDPMLGDSRGIMMVSDASGYGGYDGASYNMGYSQLSTPTYPGDYGMASMATQPSLVPAYAQGPYAGYSPQQAIDPADAYAAQRAAAIFDQFDVNHTGQLTPEQFQRAMASFSQ